MLRDTDADWQLIATHQPFFGVLANEQYYMSNLTADSKNEFYASGIADIEHVARTLATMSGGDFAPERALDFGCGVGRLTFAMGRHAAAVIGVDVADAMLDVARREAAERRVTGVQFQRSLPDQRVDWINSLIVFQHIPPERGYIIFEEMLKLLNPGGFLSVQFTFFRDARHTGEVVRDIADYRYDGKTVELLSMATSEPGAMSMYDYDLNRLMRLLYTNDFELVLAQHTDHGGCHGAWLFGMKNASAGANDATSKRRRRFIGRRS
jgi:cyclopropane fatty-acyl-phospholipid synthase-like methyltransferase